MPWGRLLILLAIWSAVMSGHSLKPLPFIASKYANLRGAHGVVDVHIEHRPVEG